MFGLILLEQLKRPKCCLVLRVRFKILPFDVEIFRLDYELTESVFFPLEEIKGAEWEGIVQEIIFFYYL